MLLVVDERIPGTSRERALVLFYRCTAGTSRESDDFADVCRLFKSTARPVDTELAGRKPGYPESYWLAVKELKLSYYSRTFTTYAQHDNLF